ncbi:hypothetical protein SAMN05443270_3789 [Lacrimispora sphenoides]|uniref:hypothetical protein n=1 Tax=Lacrimispora sphenoides TaxID=29370 RepID=UPI0008B38ED1|nr:hypothetical protein [Lacrimispora sphenoides]SEU24415.1 hypothetical protein SAMN05443270_3789 [Lacrimispora sphenoides]
MKHESIKVGDMVLEIAKGSCGLDRVGDTATVAIVIGSNTIDDIHKILTSSNVITKYDIDGKEEWKKDNLVYTGRIFMRSDFPIGIEYTQIGTEDGAPTYGNVEVMGQVFIAEYRTPTIQDEVKELQEQNKVLNAQVVYLSMMSGIEMEVGHE